MMAWYGAPLTLMLAMCRQKPHCCLSTESVLYQCRESLKRLQVASLDIYYLHSPDYKTDVDQALAAVDELHRAGEIKEFGQSIILSV